MIQDKGYEFLIEKVQRDKLVERMEAKVKLILKTRDRAIQYIHVVSRESSNVAQGMLSTTSTNISNEPTLPPCRFDLILDKFLEDEDFMKFRSNLDRYLSKRCVKNHSILIFSIVDS